MVKLGLGLGLVSESPHHVIELCRYHTLGSGLGLGLNLHFAVLVSVLQSTFMLGLGLVRFVWAKLSLG